MLFPVTQAMESRKENRLALIEQSRVKSDAWQLTLVLSGWYKVRPSARRIRLLKRTNYYILVKRGTT